jgi:stage II sporulation protein D
VCEMAPRPRSRAGLTAIAEISKVKDLMKKLLCALITWPLLLSATPARSLPLEIRVRPSNALGNALPEIQQIDFDTYLKGVVASEMPLSWPIEALKAQMVAARSFALAQANDRRQKGATYDLRDNVLDQVFTLPSALHLSAVAKVKLKKALRETEDLVLVDGKSGQILKSYYHADCGGHTEEAKDVWGHSEKSWHTVEDASCRLSSHSWSLHLKSAELGEKLHLPAPLKDARILTHTPSGRAQNILFISENGIEKTISGQDLRALLGFANLKSTAFVIRRLAKQLDGEFIFDGHGRGHGVGLCQNGARWLASIEKKGFAEILEHYYPGSHLMRVRTALDQPGELALVSALEEKPLKSLQPL